jgi:2'-5' RNA ligase
VGMPRIATDLSKLYFIAIVPPSPVYEKANELKVHFSDQYNSKASLNSPPHITLHMPFQWKEKKEAELTETLNNFAIKQTPFELKLKNFSCFSPKVIFIDVDTNHDLKILHENLRRVCKRELNLFNADYKEQPFYPHLTLAFRDLKKPAFHKAWEEFKDKDFTADFLVNKIMLLKHTGKIWQVYHEYNLAE